MKSKLIISLLLASSLFFAACSDTDTDSGTALNALSEQAMQEAQSVANKPDAEPIAPPSEAEPEADNPPNPPESEDIAPIINPELFNGQYPYSDQDIIGRWHVDSTELGGANDTIYYQARQIHLDFKADGTVIHNLEQADYVDLGGEITANWQMSGDSAHVEINYPNGYFAGLNLIDGEPNLAYLSYYDEQNNFQGGFLAKRVVSLEHDIALNAADADDNSLFYHLQGYWTAMDDSGLVYQFFIYNDMPIIQARKWYGGVSVGMYYPDYLGIEDQNPILPLVGGFNQDAFEMPYSLMVLEEDLLAGGNWQVKVVGLNGKQGMLDFVFDSQARRLLIDGQEFAYGGNAADAYDHIYGYEVYNDYYYRVGYVTSYTYYGDYYYGYYGDYYGDYYSDY